MNRPLAGSPVRRSAVARERRCRRAIRLSDVQSVAHGYNAALPIGCLGAVDSNAPYLVGDRVASYDNGDLVESRTVRVDDRDSRIMLAATWATAALPLAA